VVKGGRGSEKWQRIISEKPSAIDNTHANLKFFQLRQLVKGSSFHGTLLASAVTEGDLESPDY